MKKLVIQWRSLAQQSPSTPNGVPIRTTPPPHAPPTPSPPSCTEKSLTPATKQTSLPTTQAQSNTPDQLTSVTPSQPPSASPVPPSRPFSNPAMNRKKALHRLSTVKFATHKPQKSSLTSTSLSAPPTSTSPSPPPVTSLAPALASQSVVSTSSPVVKTTVTETPSLCSDTRVAPSSLQVRLPLHTVVKSFIVKIPLVHVAVPSNASLTPPIQTHRTTSPVHQEVVDGTLAVSGSSCNEPLPTSDPSTNGITAPLPTAQACSSEATAHAPSTLPDIHSSSSTSTQTKPPTLVVSIDRSLLLQQHLSGKLQDTTSTSLPPDPVQDVSLSSVQNDSSKSPSDSRESSPQFPPSVQHKAFSDRGYLDLNGLWRKWTDPIIHEDSFAVNVLPYVYVDGWDEELEAGVP